ncbi:MAG: energy-coupling factor transporter transmembrane component T [Coriobacteriaceae bacterium]|nr:energy-coupling factor transporter transmembrane component T [Coriobacteriaceae bacterium]
MRNVLDYLSGATPLHRLNPVAKLALATSFIIATIVTDSLFALLGLLALVYALALSAQAAPRLVSLLNIVIPVAAATLVLQLFFEQIGVPAGQALAPETIITCVKASMRLALVALPLALMLMVTRTTDLANACVEVLRIPYRYAFSFTTALRFVPMLMNEMDAIMEAQTARGVTFDSANPIKKLKLMLPLFVPLITQSVAKAEGSALAAEQRGFYLRTRESSRKRYPLRAADIAALACSAALVALGLAL